MRALLIDNNIRKQINEMVEYAESNPFTLNDLKQIQLNKKPCPGHTMGHYCFLPFGYKVVYSIQYQPSGKIRQLTMSVDAKGKLPSPPSVEEIIKLIGFKNELNSCFLHFEDIGDGEHAVSVIEFISED
jgi:hypothetical protein